MIDIHKYTIIIPVRWHKNNSSANSLSTKSDGLSF